MGLMLPHIKTTYHAYNYRVYPILSQLTLSKHSTSSSQEDNDQALPITR